MEQPKGPRIELKACGQNPPNNGVSDGEGVEDTVGLLELEVVGVTVDVALKQRGPRETPTKAPPNGGKPVALS